MSFSFKNKSAILFDMDGVLYDSMPNHSKAWSQAMEKFGMHMTPHDVYLNEGATGHDTVVRISLRDRGYEATQSEIDDIYGYKASLFRSMPAIFTTSDILFTNPFHIFHSYSVLLVVRSCSVP